MKFGKKTVILLLGTVMLFSAFQGTARAGLYFEQDFDTEEALDNLKLSVQNKNWDKVLALAVRLLGLSSGLFYN